MSRPARHAAARTLLAALATVGIPAWAQQEFVEPCARTESFAKPSTAGPFDYRTQKNSLRTVEANHFVPQIENLVRGKTSSLAAELSFVLHAFPNHHRALAAVMRYGLRERSPQPGGLDYTVDCYFERALRFRPDDVIVRMLYADQLGRTDRPDAAAAQLDYVRAVAPNNPMTQYNVGLLYLQIGRHKEALAQAHAAAALGMPRTELRDKLKAKGQWVDAPADGVATPPPAAAASAASAPGS